MLMPTNSHYNSVAPRNTLHPSPHRYKFLFFIQQKHYILCMPWLHCKFTNIKMYPYIVATAAVGMLICVGWGWESIRFPYGCYKCMQCWLRCSEAVLYKTKLITLHGSIYKQSL